MTEKSAAVVGITGTLVVGISLVVLYAQPARFVDTNRCFYAGRYQECPPYKGPVEKPAEEKPAPLATKDSPNVQPHQTKVWTLHSYNEAWGGINNVRVDVIDTAGVCLYLGFREGVNVAMTAVPKTQLRYGVGCQ